METVLFISTRLDLRYKMKVIFHAASRIMSAKPLPSFRHPSNSICFSPQCNSISSRVGFSLLRLLMGVIAISKIQPSTPSNINGNGFVEMFKHFDSNRVVFLQQAVLLTHFPQAQVAVQVPIPVFIFTLRVPLDPFA